MSGSLVLGIDPGYDRCGLAVVSRTNNKDTIVASTCVVTDKKVTLPNRICEVINNLEQSLQTYTPQAVAVETLFFSKNIKTAIDVAQVRGAIIHTCAKAGYRIIDVSPQDIKIAVTGVGNASKDNIKMILPKIVSGCPSDKKTLDDELDAIAVAVTGLCFLHSPTHQN